MEEELGMDLFGDDFFEDTPIEESDNNEQDTPDIPAPIDNNSIEDENPEEVDSDGDSDEGSDEDDGDSSSNLYSSIAKVVHENGLLPSLDLENSKIETIDDFVDAFKKESEILAQAKVDEIINNLDLQKIAQYRQDNLELDNITEDSLQNNIELAKNIIRQDYSNQGISEDKVSRLINRLSDLGEDAILEDAQESLNSLKEFNARKIEEEKASYAKQQEMLAKQQEETDKLIKQYVFDKDDIIDGLKPTKAMRESVYKSITEIVGKDEQGNLENQFMRDRREDPMGFETRMYYMYNLTNGFKDFSKLTAPAKSKAVQELEKAFKSNRVSDNGLAGFQSDANSYDGFDDFMLNL